MLYLTIIERKFISCATNAVDADQELHPLLNLCNGTLLLAGTVQVVRDKGSCLRKG